MVERGSVPEGHPVSIDQDERLVNGSWGEAAMKIALSCCLPLFWYRQCDGKILHNGTVTLVQTPNRLLGLTAAHVVKQYERDRSDGPTGLQLGNVRLNSLSIIESNSELDLATLEVPQAALDGQDVTPLTKWPPEPPQKGRGILLAGFPGGDHWSHDPQNRTVDWATLAALGTARTVSDRQITTLVPREAHICNNLPAFANLGGVSGGPMIGLFHSPNFVQYYALSGIITEHPVYDSSSFGIERLVGVRADCVTDSGKIHFWRS